VWEEGGELSLVASSPLLLRFLSSQPLTITLLVANFFLYQFQKISPPVSFKTALSLFQKIPLSSVFISVFSPAFFLFSVRPSLPSLSLFRVFLFPPFSLLLPYLLFIGRRGCGCCDEVVQPVVAAVELEEDGVGFLWQRKKEEEEKSAEIG
jgi:hypothetical protein